MAIKLTDLSLVKIRPALDGSGKPSRTLELEFECGQKAKVSPEGLIAFAERALRQAEAAKDYEPAPKIQTSFNELVGSTGE